GTGEIAIIDRDEKTEIVKVEEAGWLYAFEIDDAARAIRAGKRSFDPPGMTTDDTLGNMRVLDRWRAAVGLEYGFETPERRTTTIDGRRLTKPATPMRS